jgi:hypothetical protein
MTTRAHFLIRYVVWSVPVLLLIAIILRNSHPVIFRPKNHFSQIKAVGVALKFYADDNQGLLPQRLEDVMPDYLTEREFLDHIELVAPGAKLIELAPATVIARRPFPEDHLVTELHADMHAEAHR